MKFEEFLIKRRELGIDTYGEQSYKQLKHNPLIQMAQEELGDFVWYIRWLKKQGTNLTWLIPLIKWIYYLLEKKRR